MGKHVLALLGTVFMAAQIAAQDPTPATAAVDQWTSSIGAGLAIASGNPRAQNYNFSLSTYYAPITRIVCKADALLLRGSSDGETHADRASPAARGEYSLSARTFPFGEVS